MSSLARNQSYGLEKTTTTNKVGKNLALSGAAGGGLYLAAGLIPFINFPALLLIAVVAGLYMMIKK